MATKKEVWFIVDHLLEILHTRLLTPAMERTLPRVGARAMRAAMTGMRAHP